MSISSALWNDEVVRVETMKVGGEKIVRTEREVVLPQPDKTRQRGEERTGRASGERSHPAASRGRLTRRAETGERSGAAPDPSSAAATGPASERPRGDCSDEITAEIHDSAEGRIPEKSCSVYFPVRQKRLPYRVATADPASANEKASATFGNSWPSTST